jgi:hypothetical protein
MALDAFIAADEDRSDAALRSQIAISKVASLPARGVGRRLAEPSEHVFLDAIGWLTPD